MSIKYLTHVSLEKNELQNFAIQKLTSAPESPVLGQMYFNTADSLLYLCTAVGDTPVWTAVGSYTFGNGLSESSRVVSVVGGDGVAVDSNGVHADLASNRGLVINTDKKIDVKIKDNSGFTVDSNGFAVVPNAAKAIEVGASGVGIVVKENSGAKVTSSGLEVVVNTAHAAEVGASGVGVVLNDKAGLGYNATSGAAEVVLQSNKGLAFDSTSGALGAVVNADKGVEVGASGLGVVVKDKAGLKVSSAGLEALVDTTAGLAIDSTSGNIKAVVDTTKGLAFDSNGKLAITNGDGLEFSSNALKVKAGNGIAVASTGVAVTAGSGIAVDTNGVAVKVKTVSDVAQGLSSTSDGVAVLLDGDANLSFDANGKITLATDSAPAESSTKPLTSGGAYTALAGKVNVLATPPTASDVVSVVTYDAQGLVTGGSKVALGSASVTATGVTGVATLGTDGLVPSAQLPSYVDDVVDAYTDGDPTAENGKLYSDAACSQAITPETGKIYVVIGHKTGTTSFDGNIYRWSGSVYVCISNPLDIASTAEAKAGTDDKKVMTALKVREATNYWGTDVTATLKGKTIAAGDNTISGLLTTHFGEYAEGKSVIQTTVRSATDASDSAIPTEKAVRSALSEVVGGAVHRFTATNPALSPSSGICTWTISSTGLDADAEVQIKEVATGDYVFADVQSSTAGTVVIKFNASADVAKDTYKAIIIGVNA